MNLTHDQLIEIAYTAATYFAVGAFSVTLYSMFQRRNANAHLRGTHSTTGIDGAQTSAANQIPMSFVNFSDMAPAAAPKVVAVAKTPANRQVSEHEREAVLKIVRERLREVSPAERLADAMSRK
jgi:hypothetical protein